jgi:hypothetical protein
VSHTTVIVLSLPESINYLHVTHAEQVRRNLSGEIYTYTSVSSSYVTCGIFIYRSFNTLCVFMFPRRVSLDPSQRLAITILYQSPVGLHQLDSDSSVCVVAVAKATKPCRRNRFVQDTKQQPLAIITGGVARNL